MGQGRAFPKATENPTFDQWWRKLKILASDEGVRIYGSQSEYYDYYADGDSPANALASIVEHRDIELY